MKHLFNLIGALALGAGAMYYLDPQQGRRRRALVGDKVDHFSHDARDYLDSRRKHASDRVRGMLARVRGRFLGGEAPSDQQLYGHVRSRLGRAVCYPHAVDIDVQQGRVLLKGDILEDDFNTLMAEIWSIRGVKSIDSQLALHAEAGNVPSLQGRPRRTRRARNRYFARNGMTLLAIAGGLAAIMRALRAEGPATGLLTVATALLAVGMGDGAQRIVRRRRGRISNQRAQPAEAGHEAEHGAERQMPIRADEATPALLNPSAAFH